MPAALKVSLHIHDTHFVQSFHDIRITWVRMHHDPKNLVPNELLRTRLLIINTLPLFMTLALVIVPKLCFTSSCGAH